MEGGREEKRNEKKKRASETEKVNVYKLVL